LRWDTPVGMAPHRVTTEPVEIDGVTIPAKEIVLIGLQAANRDTDVVEHAERFDLHRDPQHDTNHLSFGYGIHYCLGAALARMEANVALSQLVSRFPDARLAVPPGQLVRRRSPIMSGYRRLPVLLGPERRSDR
jgi:cytochrome P450